MTQLAATATQLSVADRLAAVPNLVRTLMDPLTAHVQIAREIEERQLLRVVAVRPIDALEPNAVGKAERRLSAIPSWDTLRAWAKALDDVLEEQPDEERTRILVAMLLDGFPKRVPAIETYLDAASALLVDERIGPKLIAAACRRIWSSRRSPPWFADVLAEAKAARQEVINSRALVQRALATRQQAQAIVAGQEASDA